MVQSEPDGGSGPYIPIPQREVEKPFLMAVEDIFTTTGRGTVATGRMEQGKLRVGEEVEIVGLWEQAKRTGVRISSPPLPKGIC